jgi:alkanesulfonate monooxygenase SsuD/methylene tetrahydromethanopterin reductase-like flavin-dependent oxidoreductase (luciferase family)
VATNSEDSVFSAARLALPTMTSFFVPMAEVQARHHVYRETALAGGHAREAIDDRQRRSWLMRVVHVAPDREAALRAAEAPWMSYQGKMSKLRSDSAGGSVPNSFDRSMMKLRAFEDYLVDWLVVGTPDEVGERLQRDLGQAGYERVLLVMALPGLPTDLALRSMQLFAEKVAPALSS